MGCSRGPDKIVESFLCGWELEGTEALFNKEIKQKFSTGPETAKVKQGSLTSPRWCLTFTRVMPSVEKKPNSTQYRLTRSSFLHTEDGAGDYMGGKRIKQDEQWCIWKRHCQAFSNVPCVPMYSLGTLKRAHADAQWLSTVANKKPKRVLLNSQWCCSVLETRVCVCVCVCAIQTITTANCSIVWNCSICIIINRNYNIIHTHIHDNEFCSGLFFVGGALAL